MCGRNQCILCKMATWKRKRILGDGHCLLDCPDSCSLRYRWRTILRRICGMFSEHRWHKFIHCVENCLSYRFTASMRLAGKRCGVISYDMSCMWIDKNMCTTCSKIFCDGFRENRWNSSDVARKNPGFQEIGHKWRISTLWYFVRFMIIYIYVYGGLCSLRTTWRQAMLKYDKSRCKWNIVVCIANAWIFVFLW